MNKFDTNDFSEYHHPRPLHGNLSRNNSSDTSYSNDEFCTVADLEDEGFYSNPNRKNNPQNAAFELTDDEYEKMYCYDRLGGLKDNVLFPAPMTVMSVYSLPSSPYSLYVECISLISYFETAHSIYHLPLLQQARTAEIETSGGSRC